MRKKLLISFTIMSLAFLPVFASDVIESVMNIEAQKVKEVAPDTATIRFYVENTGINLNDLKEKNDKIVNAAINAIKSKLNSDESVKTVAFSVNNVYSYKDKVRIFQKYEVKNGFEVKLKDLSKISEIIKIAMDNDIKNIGQLNFSISDGEAICNQAMSDAIKIAQNRANYLAQASGTQISKIKSINPYCSLNSNTVVPRMYANSMSAKASDGAMENVVDTIEPGVISVRASVNIAYYLK